MHMFNITINKKKKEHEHRDFIFIEYVCEECKEGDWSSEIIPKKKCPKCEMYMDFIEHK
ncbi:hypothetical protein DF16_pBMB95orf00042 (plasmid) [Bacillus thuringiensis serovar kurstaki str. YBT-1520]|jgi:hypothetical protein|nr:hypothetical protein HD73_7066 [Bacillus thuringiensis serovar kurstaki str. HD73]AGG04813.1 hypothetical protein H175_107p089 [Bacillus thuringiensis serovar thuringiensis str. IS5056]AHZ55218.1 hypothetical protein YBT1520_33111 [Bacillus thuringiensis serovar kurstaki str. YBT-1520]AIE37160.1 hypothetical protein BTK_33181 [Bacillus thuringiensis serovar kurstaki str. HD-1]AKR38683.1 Hypothetical protein NF53_p4032 [Bacillus thuringiensis serovar indiana]